MPQSKYVVEYELSGAHIFRVGVQANSPDEACELVTKELCVGNLYTEDRPLLHDGFEEDGNSGHALDPAVVETLPDDRPWPAPDETVKSNQREEEAVRVCRLLAEAFVEGELTHSPPAWGWIDIAYDAAQWVLNRTEMDAIRKKVADRLGVDLDDADDPLA